MSGSQTTIASIDGAPAGLFGLSTALTYLELDAPPNSGQTQRQSFSMSLDNFGATLSAPAIVGAINLYRPLSLFFSDVIYSSQFFIADGQTDNYAQLNALMLYLYGRGGGTLVLLNTNGLNFMLSQPWWTYPKVKVIGEHRPTVQLMAGKNCALVETAYFEQLLAKNFTGIPADLTGGVYDAALEDIFFDGNASNQVSVNPDLQNGLNWGGANYFISRCVFQNNLGHGMRSFDTMGQNPNPAPPYSSFTSTVYKVQLKNSGRNGWWNNGPHDLDANTVQLINSSQSADRTYYGLFNDQAAVGRFTHIHPWNTVGAATAVPAYGIYDVGGGSQWSRLHVEQAWQGVRIDSNYNVFSSSTFMNMAAPGGANVTDGSAVLEIHGDGNQFDSVHLDCTCYTAPGNNTNTQFGIALGTTTGDKAGGNSFDGYILGADKVGPINFIGDHGRNKISARGGTPGNSNGAQLCSNGYLPNEAAGTRVSYHQSTTVIDYESASQPVQSAGGFSAWSQDPQLGLGAVDLSSTRNNGQTASGAASFVQGKNCTADAFGAQATGLQAKTWGRNFSYIRSSGDLNTPGDNQFGNQPIKGQTTSSGTRRLTTAGNVSATQNNIWRLLPGCTTVRVTATCHSTSTGDMNGVTYDGLVTFSLAQPGAAIAAPAAAPTVNPVAGGALPATTYYLKVTYVSYNGETLASAETTIAVPANQVPQVVSPPALSGAAGYNVYAATTSGKEYLQNVSPVAIGTNWTMPNTGLALTMFPISPPNTNTATTPFLNPPVAAPTLGQTAGGTLAAQTYFAVITYTTGIAGSTAGETLASPESSLAVSANNVLTVASPPALEGATGYNVYASNTTGTETKQNASPIAIGTPWTMPTTGLVAGAAKPTSNTAVPLVMYEANAVSTSFSLPIINGIGSVNPAGIAVAPDMTFGGISVIAQGHNAQTINWLAKQDILGEVT